MPAPVDLQASSADGTSEVFHQTPAIWAGDRRRATVEISTRKTLQSVVLNGGIWMDAGSTNNRWTAGTTTTTEYYRPGAIGVPAVRYVPSLSSFKL